MAQHLEDCTVQPLQPPANATTALCIQCCIQLHVSYINSCMPVAQCYSRLSYLLQADLRGHLIMCALSGPDCQ
jgi:hypothetical protein